MKKTITMKEDLTVHPFSLKQIVENLDKIGNKTGKFGEPSNDMSIQEKKQLMELMKKFNSFGHALRGDQALMETAKNLTQMSQLAKKYAMHESNSDFLQKGTIERDYKSIDKITEQFQKMAQECVSHLMQMNALYEDAGNIFERYYEMESINEGAPAPVEAPPEVEPDVDPGIAPPSTEPVEPDPLQPTRPDIKTRPKGQFGAPRGMGVKECGTCGCGRPHDTHGMEDQEEYASGFEENINENSKKKV